MSLAQYLGESGAELRMPKEKSDGIGIEHPGAVLGGEISPEAARMTEARRVVRRDLESYGSVEDYDPVLRSHCRL